jgi:hypothetical protein
MPQRRSAGYSDPHGDSRRAGARSVPGSTPIGKRYLEDAETALLYSAALARGLALPAGVVKLVDTSDSKSDALTGVPVQVRPPVPHNRFSTILKGNEHTFPQQFPQSSRDFDSLLYRSSLYQIFPENLSIRTTMAENSNPARG